LSKGTHTIEENIPCKWGNRDKLKEFTSSSEITTAARFGGKGRRKKTSSVNKKKKEGGGTLWHEDNQRGGERIKEATQKQF